MDCRTLLGSGSSKVVGIKQVNPGIYYHFGLEAGIKRFPKHCTGGDTIMLNIGIDGLPLTKSSSSAFWPILAYIFPFNNDVFPIGIYWGNEKPTDSNQYMHDFVYEAKNIIENGIIVNGSLKNVSIFVFSCDTPAKSFILKTKGHSGFSSCNRCIQEGEYLRNRVCFPYQKNCITKRTHENYINRTYDDHHVSSELSNIIEIPGIDVVKNFSLDYMHLICLGVMKKLIILWTHKGPLNVRLPSRKTQQITSLLLKLKKYITCDFSRKPREVEAIHRWKATEMRQFLLYTGPLVLKDVLSHECYVHFHSLSIAMTILLSPDKQDYVQFAKDLLDYFVENYQHLYGKHYLSNNIHSILHLVDDYNNFGPLDNCSAFYFENYMKNLKSMVRKHENPLQQVVKRYDEMCDFKLDNSTVQNSLKKKHFKGPLTSDTIDPQYTIFVLNNIKIKTNNNADCYILTTDDVVIKVLNIAHFKSNNNIAIVGVPFLFKKNMYEKPIKSCKLNIYVVSNLSENTKSITLSEIKQKMMVLPLNEIEFIALPIMHSDPSAKSVL